jgi:hypothetical protein
MQVIPAYRVVLDSLSNGKVARLVFLSFLRIGGTVAAVFFVFLLVLLLKWSFQAESSQSTFAGLALALVLAVGFLGVVYVFFYRAETVSKLKDPHYSIIPAVSVLLRAAGEISVMLGISIGLGGCVFIWLAKANPLGLIGRLTGVLPFVPPAATWLGGFVGGLIFLAYFLVQSIVVVTACYFLAEALVVLTEIAANTRRSAESITHLGRRESGLAGGIEPPQVVPVALASGQRR